MAELMPWENEDIKDLCRIMDRFLERDPDACFEYLKRNIRELPFCYKLSGFTKDRKEELYQIMSKDNDYMQEMECEFFLVEYRKDYPERAKFENLAWSDVQGHLLACLANEDPKEYRRLIVKHRECLFSRDLGKYIYWDLLTPNERKLVEKESPDFPSNGIDL